MVKLSLHRVGEAVRDRVADARERRARRRHEEEDLSTARLAGYHEAVGRLRATREGSLAARPPISETLAQLRQAHPAPPGGRPDPPETLPPLVLTTEQARLLSEYAAAIGVEPVVLRRALEDRQRLNGISAHFLGAGWTAPLPTLFPSSAHEPFGDESAIDLAEGGFAVPATGEVIEVEVVTMEEER